MARATMAVAMVAVVLVALARLPESSPVPTRAASADGSEAALSAGPGWRAGVSGLEAIPVTEAPVGPSTGPSDLALTDEVSSSSAPDTTVPHTHPSTTTTAPPVPHTHPPDTTVPPHTHPSTTTTAPPVPHTHPPTTTAPPAPPALLAAPEVVGTEPATQVQEGVASWFGAPERTCAHLTIPKGTEVTVTLLTPAGPGPSVTCVINDYGPTDTSRIIDLSDDTFEVLAPLSAGLIDVRIEW